MIDVVAQTVVTPVKDVHAIRDRAMSIYPCLPVNAGVLAVYLALAVAVRSPSACPFNAVHERSICVRKGSSNVFLKRLANDWRYREGSASFNPRVASREVDSRMDLPLMRNLLAYYRLAEVSIENVLSNTGSNVVTV